MIRSLINKNHLSKNVLLPVLGHKRIAILSTYIPRKCGIATFTKDLSNSINSLNPDRLVEIIALDKGSNESLSYPWEVSKIINQDRLEDYLKVADYINKSTIDLVIIQHEYGIFGGQYGSYILDFIQALEKPFIVILHTILQNPSPNQRIILQKISKKAKLLVTMLPSALGILEDTYEINKKKISIIPHGTPDFPFLEDNTEIKTMLGLKDKIVMSSVNLMDPNKGFENVLWAIPKIKKRYPNFVYLIIGQTHPDVLERFGESYRKGLKQLVASLGIEENVKFINHYIDLKDVVNYISASDFFVTPYNNTEQISSGSLSYAIAAGNLCISTPYRYALENLSGGRGYIVNSKNSQDIAQAVFHALSHPKQSYLIRQKCYNLGRKMTWNRVAYSYLEKIQKLIKNTDKRINLNKPSIKHIKWMSNSTGLLEHSGMDKIKYEEGYSTDDNARGLIVALLEKRYKLANIYLDFLLEMEKNGKMYCDLSYDKKWIGKAGFGDWYGRSFWAACFAVIFGTAQIKQKAKVLLTKLSPSLNRLTALRAKAYCLIGLSLLIKHEPDYNLDIRQISKKLSEDLISAYSKNADKNWFWFENTITYDNARLSQALLAYSRATEDRDSREIGLTSLNFFIDQTYDIRDGCFKFVGSDGWYPKEKLKSEDNEQPIEAGSMTEVLGEAYMLTEKFYYLEMAQLAFSWYLGNNARRYPMLDLKSGAVCDGIGKMFGDLGINLNQGAESTLSYHLGYYALEQAENLIRAKSINNHFHTPQNSSRYFKHKRFKQTPSLHQAGQL